MALTIDEYLETMRAEPIINDDLIRITLRAGSYIGEVIRQNARPKYNWIEFSETMKICNTVKGLGNQIGTISMLYSKPENFVFPLAKVLKKLENGPEDNVHSFAKVVISGL